MSDRQHEDPEDPAGCDPRYLEGWRLAHARRAKGESLEDLRALASPDSWSEERANGFSDRLADECRAPTDGVAGP